MFVLRALRFLDVEIKIFVFVKTFGIQKGRGKDLIIGKGANGGGDFSTSLCSGELKAGTSCGFVCTHIAQRNRWRYLDCFHGSERGMNKEHCTGQASAFN